MKTASTTLLATPCLLSAAAFGDYSFAIYLRPPRDFAGPGTASLSTVAPSRRQHPQSYEEEDLSGIPDLVEVIKLQASGPSEAARAIRKKLKYGNVHRQIRALVLLDGLIQNAGERFQRTFADEPLLERLRVCGTDQLSDPEVKKKCRELFRSWAQYAGTPGLDRIARLHKVSCSLSCLIADADLFRNFLRGRLPQPKRDQRMRFRASTARRNKFPTTRLRWSNSKLVNFSGEKCYDTCVSPCRVSSDDVSKGEQIHHVEHEQWLGGLLHANDELVHALMTFEQLDRSIDADSDSDDELAEQAHLYRSMTHPCNTRARPTDTSTTVVALKGKEAMASGHSPTTSQPPDLSELHIATSPKAAAPPRPPPMAKPGQRMPPPQPPRPAPPPAPPAPRQEPKDEEEDDDPFGDNHVIDTPAVECEQPRW
ncbi:hypothetical protein AUP68_05911 [Ilyonectria robusta]